MSICDDPNVAVIVDSPQVPVAKGVKRGTTLCSVRSGDFRQFQLMKVTVY